MELMFIVSAPMITTLAEDSLSHLVLPHLYVENGNASEYLTGYRKLRKRNPNHFFMQDNSIFELKHTVAGNDVGDLVNYARMIGANEVVVPEVLRDFQNSRELTLEFLGSARYQGSRNLFSLAAVVQGKTYEEIAAHYRWLLTQPEIQTICVAFNYEFDAWGDCDEEKRQAGWNRFSIITRLYREGIWNCGRKHHLLGLFNPAELAQYHRADTLHFPESKPLWNSIRSNDSSSCYWHSLYGVHFDPGWGLLYKKIETSVDFSTRFTTGVQLHLFNENADVLKLYARGLGGGCLWEKYVMWAREKGVEVWV